MFKEAKTSPLVNNEFTLPLETVKTKQKQRGFRHAHWPIDQTKDQLIGPWSRQHKWNQYYPGLILDWSVLQTADPGKERVENKKMLSTNDWHPNYGADSRYSGMAVRGINPKYRGNGNGKKRWWVGCIDV